ncbi:PP2C family protein-serine/threonine phosphatase [Flammeovirga pacifica]|uniref:PPM-type phosphatase domain-containing protein n=1 Tax=Flammeovirga pacifica TaxID=915059 RepID=A0A1S1YYI3_FLAPC|nr:SpoIIE family protein phosphatase [Flammeovirga pacifica]OHX66071.1 hypothetical protein NH26_06760 [Flammeovirga pacifica]
MFKRVQSNIFSYFFSVVIITFLVLVVIINTIITKTENKAVEERLHDVGLALKDFIQREFEDKEKAALTLSKTITDKDLQPLYTTMRKLEGKEFDPKELQKNFDRIYSEYGKKNKGKFNGKQLGQLLVQNNFDKNGLPFMLWLNNKKNSNEIAYRTFYSLQKQLKQFSEIMLSEEVMIVNMEKGRIIASSVNQAEIGQSAFDSLLSERDIREKLLMVNEGKRKYYWIDVSKSKINNDHTRCYLATKVGDQKKYVMLYAFNTNHWTFNNSVEEHSTDIFLTGKDGLMRTNSSLFRKNSSAVLLRMSQEGYNLDDLEEAKKRNSVIGFQKVDDVILKNIQKFEDKIVEAKSVNGIHVLAHTTQLKRAGLDWYMVVEWSRDVAFAEWETLRVFINSAIAIIAIFFLLGILYGGKKLTKPVLAFKEALKDVIDNPKLFLSNSHKYRNVTSDMLQQLEIICSEVSKLYEHNDQLKNQLKMANIHSEKMNATIENQTVDSKKLHIEKEQFSKGYLEYKNLYSQYITSINNVLKTTIFDDNFYQLNSYGGFIIQENKSEISGDFIWVHERESRAFVILADTGKYDHQAALIRVVLSDLLTEVIKVKKVSSPERILEFVHKSLYDLIIKGEEIFDKELCLSVCVWDRQKQMIEYAGANQSLFITRDEKYDEFEGENYGVGGIGNEAQLKFITHYIPLNRVKSCYLYLFTDGIIQQVNPSDQEFTKNRLKELIIDVQIENIEAQHEYINKTLIEWRENKPVNDDQTLIGFKVV